MNTTKVCPQCNRDLHFQEYGKDACKANGLRSWCKECQRKKSRESRLKNPGYHNAYVRAWGARNKDRIKNRDLKCKYGISLDDYNRMLEEQGNRCGICLKGKENFQARLYVDHCHKTGTVRKLLCARCNFFIGYMEANRERLNNALTYLGLDSIKSECIFPKRTAIKAPRAE